MDTIEVYRHIINSEEANRSRWDSNPGTLELDIKALFDVDYIVYADEDSMPTLCQALLDSRTEMTQKFHTLARRGADGDTRWMFDSYGYPRVQYKEFYDRYVNGNCGWQRNAMIGYWLDVIAKHYDGSDWRVPPEDHVRTVILIETREIEWLGQQHELALEQDKEVEEERERIRQRDIEARAAQDRARTKAARQWAGEAARRQEEAIRRHKEVQRKRKHQQKISYMMSLMS